MISHARLNSPLGDILMRVDATAISGLYFDGQAHQPPDLTTLPRYDDHPLVQRAQAWLAAYFGGKPQPSDLPLLLQGTAFQQRVWAALQRIPSGATATYADIAQTVGSPAAVRAVGAAVGRNPVSIVVPCHRVVGSNGSLTGYAGGLSRKTHLLTLEGAWPRERPGTR